MSFKHIFFSLKISFDFDANIAKWCSQWMCSDFQKKKKIINNTMRMFRPKRKCQKRQRCDAMRFVWHSAFRFFVFVCSYIAFGAHQMKWASMSFD